MREMIVDLWDLYDQDQWIAVTTNGAVRRDGCAVMGRGVAFQASNRFPRLAPWLGSRIRLEGNHVFCYATERLFTFPVKHHWKKSADLDLILRSSCELIVLLDLFLADYEVTGLDIRAVYLPRPGCGNGQLQWASVKPVIESILDDRVIVVEHPSRAKLA